MQVSHPSLETLSAFLDGDLPEPELAEVRAHLAACQNCRAAIQSLEQSVHALRTLPEIDAPPGFTQKVMARIDTLDRRGFRAFVRRWRLGAILAPVAAATLVVVMIRNPASRHVPMPAIEQAEKAARQYKPSDATRQAGEASQTHEEKAGTGHVLGGILGGEIGTENDVASVEGAGGQPRPAETGHARKKRKGAPTRSQRPRSAEAGGQGRAAFEGASPEEKAPALEPAPSRRSETTPPVPAFAPVPPAMEKAAQVRPGPAATAPLPGTAMDAVAATSQAEPPGVSTAEHHDKTAPKSKTATRTRSAAPEPFFDEEKTTEGVLGGTLGDHIGTLAPPAPSAAKHPREATASMAARAKAPDESLTWQQIFADPAATPLPASASAAPALAEKAVPGNPDAVVVLEYRAGLWRDVGMVLNTLGATTTPPRRYPTGTVEIRATLAPGTYPKLIQSLETLATFGATPLPQTRKGYRNVLIVIHPPPR